MTPSLIPIRDIPTKVQLKQFDCGIEQLNSFFARFALKNDLLGLGKTFVAVNEHTRIVGYFTLAAAQLKFDEIPEAFQRKLPKYPIPSLRIARFAVHKENQGQGIAKWLLAQAFKKIITVSEITGLKFVLVDAKENSKSFYEHYGFLPLAQEHLTYFLPIETIKLALKNKADR